MNKKRIIIIIVIAVSAVILGVGAALVFNSLGTGNSFRGGSCASAPSPTAEAVQPSPSDDPQIIVVPSDEPTEKPQQGTDETPVPATPEPSPTPDPYVELMEKADTSMMKDIVNILLIGVDYSTERETWNGKKDWHSDVMIVLAVNFEENRADMITLPRDTYANIPGVKGIYKLNASLNCGGDLYNKDGSFNPKGPQKVCEAAEWMLGGIDVDYYYLVTMTSLKELVDLCGGLDYDMDISFKIQGRSYEKGLQHIDGQGFLDYCRVRKTENGLTASQAGDARRVERQKKMLIALFKQMKADQLITKIPEIISTFDGELYTNCTLGQTAALAAFAYNLDPNNIGMYAMSGDTRSLFHWNFCFTNQSNRVDVIQKVYGVKVKRYNEYTLAYARYRWCDMLYTDYKELLDPLTKYVQKLIDEDDLLPEFTSSPTPSEEPTEAPTETPATPPPTEKPTEPPTEKPTEAPTEKPTEPPASDEPDANRNNATETGRRGVLNEEIEETRKYTQEQRDLFEEYKKAVEELEELHKQADKEAKKAAKGNSNSLNDVGTAYLAKLDEVQTLAIQVATVFKYTKVKNFTVEWGATRSGWNKNSPWACNYGLDRKFNEISVDFN